MSSISGLATDPAAATRSGLVPLSLTPNNWSTWSKAIVMYLEAIDKSAGAACLRIRRHRYPPLTAEQSSTGRSTRSSSSSDATTAVEPVVREYWEGVSHLAAQMDLWIEPGVKQRATSLSAAYAAQQRAELRDPLAIFLALEEIFTTGSQKAVKSDALVQLEEALPKIKLGSDDRLDAHIARFKEHVDSMVKVGFVEEDDKLAIRFLHSLNTKFSLDHVVRWKGDPSERPNNVEEAYSKAATTLEQFQRTAAVLDVPTALTQKGVNAATIGNGLGKAEGKQAKKRKRGRRGKVGGNGGANSGTANHDHRGDQNNGRNGKKRARDDGDDGGSNKRQARGAPFDIRNHDYNSGNGSQNNNGFSNRSNSSSWPSNNNHRSYNGRTQQQAGSGKYKVMCATCMWKTGQPRTDHLPQNCHYRDEYEQQTGFLVPTINCATLAPLQLDSMDIGSSNVDNAFSYEYSKIFCPLFDGGYSFDRDTTFGLDTMASDHTVRTAMLPLMSNIRDTSTKMEGWGGVNTASLCGDLPYFGSAVISDSTPLNFLSYGRLSSAAARSEGWVITVDPDADTFTVHNSQLRLTWVFEHAPENVYVSSIIPIEKRRALHAPTVVNGQYRYSIAEVSRCLQYREFHSTVLSHASDDSAIRTLKIGGFPNCGFTEKDIYNARKLFGECEGCLRGKMLAPAATAASAREQQTVPGVLQHVDIFFVLGPNKTRNIMR